MLILLVMRSITGTWTVCGSPDLEEKAVSGQPLFDPTKVILERPDANTLLTLCKNKVPPVKKPRPRKVQGLMAFVVPGTSPTHEEIVMDYQEKESQRKSLSG